ncbi:MAG TPA: peptidoglycan editing factor PgeF [Kineosporiaceae bacterium]|nr:peptidoglycan editing factor PgeF [Kineosporiaceae bacterium]
MISPDQGQAPGRGGTRGSGTGPAHRQEGPADTGSRRVAASSGPVDVRSDSLEVRTGGGGRHRPAPAGGPVTGGAQLPGARVLEVDLGRGVRAGFTERAGGVSVGPWAGLDLGLHVGDDPGDVQRNRRLLLGWAGAPVQFPRQVHGTDVLVVDASARGLLTGVDPAEPARDAIVTAAVGVPVGVLVADCVPVLLADPVAGVVGAAHAGRKGLLRGVVENAVAAMCALGASPARIYAAIGPCAGPCCYEVPEQLRAESARRLPQTWAGTRWGTPSLDLPGGCRAALERVGVTRLSTIGRCTIEDKSYYSYRREPVTGRFAGVVMMSA